MDKEVKNRSMERISRLEQIHISDYLAILRKHKWVIIIFSLIVVGLVTALSLLSTPLYQATAQIVIERQPYPLSNVQQSINSEIREQYFYDTQCNLLKSRSLALKVVEELDLWKDFHRTSPNSKDRVSADETEIVNWYLSNLEIEPVRGSRLINIKFWSTLPEKSARVANAHSRAFIEKSNETSLSGLNWIKIQLQEQKKKVESSQRAMHEYKKAHNITSFEDRHNIVAQKLMDLNSTLTKVKSERLSKEAVYQQLKKFNIKNENIYSLPEVAQDSVILNLRNQLIQLRTKLLEVATNYGPKHPKMMDLNAQIGQLEIELTGEVRRLSSSIKAELDRAFVYERSIQQALNAQKSEALSLSEKAIRYDVIRDEAESNQQIHDSLLKQAKELGLVSTSERGNISIVDEAEVPPVPAKPKTFLNILMSIAASMFIGPLLAFFFEYMDGTIKVPDDVRRRLGMPVLGMLPRYRVSKKKENSPLTWDSDEAVRGKNAKSYCAVEDFSVRLIQGVQAFRQEEHVKVLFVEGSTAGEGKTTVLANAAAGLARRGFSVLMIDADIVNPSLQDMCRVSNGGGLVNIMEEMYSHQITEGGLDRYSVDDLFFLIAMRKLGGHLTVKNGSQTMTALFESGRLLHLGEQECHFTNLGTILLREGMLSEDHLKNALTQNKHGPLGYVLINSGYITLEQLKKSLRLLMEDRLQKLFSWKDGRFTFEPVSFRTYDDKRIFFEEDYIPTFKGLGRISGNRLLENMILSRITQVHHNVSLLPAGTSENRLAGPTYEMLFSKFLDITKRHFDIILVDNPPLLEVPDAAPLSSLADGVVFVIRAGCLSFKAISEALLPLKETGANILGTVINQAKISKNYYKY